MADLSYTKNYVDAAALTEAKLDAAFTSIQTYINDRQDGTSAWDALNVAGAATLQSTLAVTGASTFTGGVTTLFGYRRPNLVYSSATAVNVENNTGTDHQTTIVFPDGTSRSVTEDVSSTHKYRQFLITATAEFTSGTEDSGLRSGLSEDTNTWYAIYAVKSAIDTTKFVLSGDTTLPLQANFSTLNSRYGTNAWVYLGMIRNGDQSSATGDILSFVQTGATTLFRNSCLATETHAITGNGREGNGVLLASSASSTTTTWTYAAGTAGQVVPNHISMVSFTGFTSASSSSFVMQAQTDADLVYYRNASFPEGIFRTPLVVASLGLVIVNGTSSSRDIILSSYIDPILANPYALV